MSEKDNPRGWGGRRPGAGAKPEGDEPMVKGEVFMLPEEWDFAKEQGDGIKSRGVRAIVRRAMAAAKRRRKK